MKDTQEIGEQIEEKSETLVSRSDSLADKMNKLTAKFQSNLDNAEDLHVTGEEIIEYVEEKTQSYNQNLSLHQDNGEVAQQIVNLDNMVDDFKYVRETLKENIENGRRVLNQVTLNLLDADEEEQASLVIAFAQLNSAIATNSKIYLSSYKQISDIILNLDKVKKKEKDVFDADQESKGGKTENHLHIHGDAVSTVELIKQLNNSK